MRRTGSTLARLGAVTVVLLVAACGTLPVPARQPSAPPIPPAAASSAPDGTDSQSATDSQNGTDPSPSESGDASCPSDIVARICAEVSLTGATSVSGRGVVTAPVPPGADPSTTCADIAGSDDGGNLGDHLDTVDGHQLAWDTALTDFHGPGTYPGSEFHLTIDDDAYSASGRGKVSITIGADFATTITVSHLLSSGDSPGEESGTITWTCVDPTGG